MKGLREFLEFADLISNILSGFKIEDSIVEINKIVYNLYNLSSDEILYIEDREP